MSDGFARSRKPLLLVSVAVAVAAVAALVLLLLPGDPHSSKENVIDAAAEAISEQDEAGYRDLVCVGSYQRDAGLPVRSKADVELVAFDDTDGMATLSVDIQDFELLLVLHHDNRGQCIALAVVCTRKGDLYGPTGPRAVACRHRPRP